MSSLPVSVFCSQHIKSVELFTGTQSRGAKTPTSRHISGGNAWQLAVPAAGTPIIAVGKDAAGAAIAYDTMTAYGAAAKIVLSTEQPSIVADGGDCSSIIATVCDQNGVWHRTAANAITFSFVGPANYRGGFNHSGAKNVGSTVLNAEQGKIAVGIRSTNTAGSIVVSAFSPGLTTGTMQIRSVAPDTNFTAISIQPPQSCTQAIPGGVNVISSPGGVFRVAYFMPCAGNAAIVFFDIQGRVVHQINTKHSAAGMYRISWNTRGAKMASGVHLVRVRAGNRFDAAVVAGR
jgi:hypothetical protein